MKTTEPIYPLVIHLSSLGKGITKGVRIYLSGTRMVPCGIHPGLCLDQSHCPNNRLILPSPPGKHNNVGPILATQLGPTDFVLSFNSDPT